MKTETTRSISEEYGDIRQKFDLWVNRLSDDKAEWCIKDIQDAFDALAEFVPEEK